MFSDAKPIDVESLAQQPLSPTHDPKKRQDLGAGWQHSGWRRSSGLRNLTYYELRAPIEVRSEIANYLATVYHHRLSVDQLAGMNLRSLSALSSCNTLHPLIM